MATWEDGPEYAPLERPAGFSLPDTPPLEVAPPAQQPVARAPMSRPEFASPTGTVVALETLEPPAAEQRDPAVPFEVVSSTVTSMDSAWGAAHWSPPQAVPGSGAVPPLGPGPGAGPATGSAAALGAWGPPSAGPWPPPTAPMGPVGGPAVPPGGYPAPGTTQWFGPGPYAEQRTPPPPVDARAVFEAATPGLCICLAIGGFVFLLAPINLCLAFALSARVKVAKQKIRRAFLVAMGLLALFAVIGAGSVTTNISFGAWWAFVGSWALLLSWVVLIMILILVYRELKNGPPRPPHPDYSSNWG